MGAKWYSWKGACPGPSRRSTAKKGLVLTRWTATQTDQRQDPSLKRSRPPGPDGPAHTVADVVAAVVVVDNEGDIQP